MKNFQHIEFQASKSPKAPLSPKERKKKRGKPSFVSSHHHGASQKLLLFLTPSLKVFSANAKRDLTFVFPTIPDSIDTPQAQEMKKELGKYVGQGELLLSFISKTLKDFEVDRL